MQLQLIALFWHVQMWRFSHPECLQSSVHQTVVSNRWYRHGACLLTALLNHMLAKQACKSVPAGSRTLHKADTFTSYAS